MRSVQDEAAQKPKRASFSILGGWGQGVAAAYTQNSVTSLRKHPFLLALRRWGRFAWKSEEKLMFSQATL